MTSMDDNPFKAPLSRVADPGISLDGQFLPEGRRVPAGNGWLWVLKAWELFQRAPTLWIGMTLLYMVIVFFGSLLPIVSMAVPIFMPVFMGGFMLGCKALDEGRELEIGHLFACFSQQLGNLVIVGLLYMAGVFIATIAMAVVFVILFFLTGMDGNPLLIALAILMAILLGTVLLLPLVMAIWYAPALVVFHDLTPFESMKASLMISIKNILPFLIYGLALLILGIIATLPCFLGWLVLSPVMMASIYTSYRDMFVQN